MLFNNIAMKQNFGNLTVTNLIDILNGSDDEEESEVEISGDVDENEENAEGAVWNGSVNGNHGVHHNTLPSQMAAAEGAEAEDEQGTNGGNQNKQVRMLYSLLC